MGVALYPVFEGGASEFPDDINGKCLARAITLLDKECKRLSIPALNDFFSMSREAMIVEILDGDPEDLTSYDPSALPEEHWFDAKAGLVTVRALLECVRKSKESFADFDAIGLTDCVLQDLEAFEQLLTRAEESDVRWHLAIDY